MGKNASENSIVSEQLGRLLRAIEASGRAVLPGSNLELLQSIVDAAARIFGAAAASISLVDQAQGELAFMVACGIGGEDVVGMRIPQSKGIAGYVAMTGQPISISDVQRDPRFMQDFAQSTGYVPRSILATPLIYADQVIGVMEVLDKIDAPSFGMQDMELLAVFARQAAIAINQSQQVDLLEEALVQGIKNILASQSDVDSSELLQTLDQAGRDTADKTALLEMATFFYEIGAIGPAEQKMCIEIISAFREYFHTRPKFFR